MPDHIDEQNAEITRANIAVVEAHEAFLDALREGKPATEVDRLYDEEQAARYHLDKTKERHKARDAGVLEVWEREARDADAEELAKARRAVAKVAKRFDRHVAKAERGIEILTEAIAGIERTSAEAFKAMHASDRDKAAREAASRFKSKIAYALQVQLAAKGIAVLPDTSIVRSHQRSISPRSVVDGFVRTVKRGD